MLQLEPCSSAEQRAEQRDGSGTAERGSRQRRWECVRRTQAYRRDPSGALSVIDPGPNPNGITLSPDEQHLYLSHLGTLNNVIVFDVDASGAVSNPQPFINGSSDGMAIDCAGNLYITQAQVGVRVYDPSGNALGTLAAMGAANVAFGGPERRTLFIAAQTTLYSVDLQIPGLPY